MQRLPFPSASCATLLAALALLTTGAQVPAEAPTVSAQPCVQEVPDETDPWVLLRRARLEEGLIRSERTAVLLGELLATRPADEQEQTDAGQAGAR